MQIDLIIINVDNRSVIAVTSNPEYHARTKHIDIQYYYVREKTQNGTAIFNYILTAEQAVDGLIKTLKRVKYEHWMSICFGKQK